MKRTKGFTLVEILVSIMIFAIISLMSYSSIYSLITAKTHVLASMRETQDIAILNNNLNQNLNNIIPLVIRDNNHFIPALHGIVKLNNKYDSQIEMTVAGYLDSLGNVTPPRRIGYRFSNNNLYFMKWDVLNRVATSSPQIILLMDNVVSFTPEYLDYNDIWQTYWPLANLPPHIMPVAIKITVQLTTGTFEKVWATSKKLMTGL